MHINIFLLISILFWGVSLDAKSTPSQIAFEKANEAYANEKYDIAIIGYEQVLSSQQHSLELYYNLANAHYKLNHVSEAIYYYEKALLLDPSNEEVINNLSFANQMKMDAIEALPKDKATVWTEHFVTQLSTDEWAYLSILLFLISILCLIFYIYAIGSKKKRLFFTLVVLGLMTFGISMGAAYYSAYSLESKVYAIIFAEEYTTRAEPRLSSEPAQVLHEGTKVEVIATFDDWAHIKLANGATSWIPQGEIKEL